MSKRIHRTLMLALVCVLAGRAVVDAGPGKKPRDAAAAAPPLTRVVYSVADLIVPIDNGDAAGAKPGKTLEDPLMDLVRSTVVPSSWRAQGGPGTIQYLPLGMALIVNQTAEAHAAIADLFKALRRLQDVEVSVELRIVRLSPEMAASLGPLRRLEPSARNQYSSDPNERMREELNQSENLRELRKEWARFWDSETAAVTHDEPKSGLADRKPADDKRAAVFLSAEDLADVLKELQADSATCIMQAPKVTLFNGQQGTVQIGQFQTFVTEYKVVRDGSQLAVVPHHETVHLGMKCKLLPTVSADRRLVQLKLDFRQTNLDGPVQGLPVQLKLVDADGTANYGYGMVQQPACRRWRLKQACTIPDGQTMAIALGAISEEVPQTRALAVLKDIPFLRHCIVNVESEREPREVFLFVTPRIHVNEEDEAEILLNTEPRLRP